MGTRARMHSEATVVISLTVLATVLPIVGAGGIMATGGIAAILLTTIAIRRRMVAASSIGVLLVVVLLLALIFHVSDTPTYIRPPQPHHFRVATLHPASDPSA